MPCCLEARAGKLQANGKLRAAGKLQANRDPPVNKLPQARPDPPGKFLQASRGSSSQTF